MSAGLAPALTDYRPIETSFEGYKREQSGIARRRLYPLTVFYTTYSLIVTLLLLNSRDRLLGIMFYLVGVPAGPWLNTFFIATSPTAAFAQAKVCLAALFTRCSTRCTGSSTMKDPSTGGTSTLS